MLQGLDDYLNEEKVQQIAALGHHPDMEEREVIRSRRIRSEKVAIKMCIRDSIHTDCSNVFCQGQHQFFTKWINGRIGYLGKLLTEIVVKPVSYTHLDVYKRQSLIHSGCFLITPM